MTQPAAPLRPGRHWSLLIPLGLSYLWFFILEVVEPHPRYFMYTPMDDFIPFLPVFIIPYVIWYFYIAVPGVVLLLQDAAAFCRYASFLTGCMMISCAIYTFLPNGILLRPDLTGEPGAFNAVIRLLYSIDTPTNSAPSLHVAQSVGAHVAILRYNRKNKKKRGVLPASLVLCVLIMLSTVFIKQHSVLDIWAGLLLAAVLYFAVYFKRRNP